MIFLLTKLLSYQYILACVVAYSNRGDSQAVAKLCIAGIKKAIKKGFIGNAWYIQEYFKHIVPALLKIKDPYLSSEFLSLVADSEISDELLKSDAAVLQGVSQIFYRQRNLQEALRYVLYAADKKPDDAWIQYLCGWCYVASQQSDEAIPYLKKSIELDSSYKAKIESDPLIAKDLKLLGEFRSFGG